MLRIRIAVAAVATTTALLCALPSGASATTSTFSCTGSSATFTVPSGISRIWFDVKGAGGGKGGEGETSWWGHNPGGWGGTGAQQTGIWAVSPGDVFTVRVGCKGNDGSSNANNGSGGNGGWGVYTGGTGGRSGSTSCGFLCSKSATGAGAGGGGASGISLGSLYAVAGGGGGGGGGAWNSWGGSAYGATQGAALANGSNGSNAGAGNGGGGASGGGGGVGQNAGGGDNGGNGGQNGRSAISSSSAITSATFNASGGPTSQNNGSITIQYISTALAFSSAPSGDRYSTSESIAFSGDSDASFTCSVDGGAYSACTSPKSITGLSLGAHTLAVKQSVGGLTSDAITASWNTAVPPAPVITSSDLTSFNYTKTATPAFAFTTVSGATVTCAVDSGAYAACTSPKTLSTLTEGAHTFKVRQVTSSGTGDATSSFTVDLTAPDAAFFYNSWSSGSGALSVNTDSPEASISAVPTDVSFDHFDCQVDGGSWVACGTSAPKPSGLSEGSHTLAVRRVDKAGNIGTATYTRSFTVDLTAPGNLSWTKQAPQYVSRVNYKFDLSWAGFESGNSIECDAEGRASIRWDTAVSRYTGGYSQSRLDAFPSSGFCTFSPGVTTSGGLYNASLELKEDPGANWASMTYKDWTNHNTGYLRIRQVDPAGNASEWIRTDWTMDWDAPAAPTVVSGPGNYLAANSTSISFSGESDATFKCALDYQPLTTCTSPLALTGLSEGYRRVNIYQIDHAGQWSPVKSVAFNVDTVKPVPPRVDAITPSGASVSSSDIRLGFAYSDLVRLDSGAYSTECSLDGSDWAACSGGSYQTYSGLSEGSHSFRVRQTDAAGNVGDPTTYTWAIDKTPPAAPTMDCPTPVKSEEYLVIGGISQGGVCYLKPGLTQSAVSLRPNFKGEAGATFECRAALPSGGSVTKAPASYTSWQSCSWGSPFTDSTDWGQIPAGVNYSYESRQKDAAGNVGPVGKFLFNVDNSVPTEAVLSTKPIARPKDASESDSTPSFAFDLKGTAADVALQKVKCAIKPGIDRWPGSSAAAVSGYTDCTNGFTSEELEGGNWTLFYYTVDEVGNTNDGGFGHLYTSTYSFVVLPKPLKPRVVLNEANSPYETYKCDSYWGTYSGSEYGSKCPDLSTYTFGGGIDFIVSTDPDGSNNMAFGSTVNKLECAWEGPGISGVTAWADCPNLKGPGGSGSTYTATFSKKTSGTWTLHTRGRNSVGAGPERVVTVKIDADPTPKPTITFTSPAAINGVAGDAWKTGMSSWMSGNPWLSTTLPTFNGDSVGFTVGTTEATADSNTAYYGGDGAGTNTLIKPFTICALAGPHLVTGYDGNTYKHDSDYGPCSRIADDLTRLAPGPSGYMYELTAVEYDTGGNRSDTAIAYFKAASGPASVKDFKTMSSSPTSSSTLTYSLTFDTDVTGLTAADFETTGTSTGWAVDSVTGSGAGPYTVTLKGTSASDGTVGVKLLKEAGQSPTGDASPAADKEAGEGAKVTIDHTAPGGFATEAGGVTNASSLTYDLDFSEAVTGLTASDLSVGGTATGWSVSSVSGSGTHWSVTITPSSGATDGTVNVTLAAGSVLDGASNAGPGTDVSTADTTVDRTAPAAPVFTAVPGSKTAETQALIKWTGEAGAIFECKIGDGSWSACASPQALGTEANSQFAVRQVDAAGNTSSAASTTWEFTGSLPGAPDISGAPAGATKSSSASLSFGPAQSGGGTFKCSVDGGEYSVCTSPLALTGLAEGDHSVAIREVTAGGRLGDVATATWAVDNTAPAKPEINSAPTGSVGSDSAEIAFSSEGGATVKCSVDGGAATTCTSPLSLSGLSEGSHTVSIYQVDEAGNTGESRDVSWTVDTTAPAAPTLSGEPSSSTTATTFSISAAGEDGAKFECKLDSGAWTSCSSPFAAGGIGVGSHTAQIRQIDAAGNTGPAASATWSVVAEDLPVPTINAGSSSPTKDATPRFTFASDDGKGFECSIDNGAWATCATPYTASSLTDGEHTLRVRETDGNGAYSPAASKTFTVDTLAPALPSVTAQPEDGTTSTSGSVEFTEETGLSYRCKVDDGDWQDPCSSPISLSGLAVGTHQVRITATDEAGNQSDAQIVEWTISGAAVTAPTLGAGPTTPTKVTSASVEFTLAADTVSECSLDGGSWTRCESPWTASDLSDRLHTLRVRAVDADGNKSGAQSVSWTVDTTGPAAPSITSEPAASTLLTTASIGFTAETGSTVLCSVDNGAWETCTSPLSLTGLEGGAHNVRIKAADSLGNEGATSTVNWTIRQPSSPVLKIFPGEKSNVTNEGIYWEQAETPAVFQCSLDGAAWANCNSSPSQQSKNLNGLSLGEHTFKVRAQVGGGGAWSQPTSITWTVVNTSSIAAPLITPAPAWANPTQSGVKWTNSDSPVFTPSATGAVSYECTDLVSRGSDTPTRLASLAWRACTDQELRPTGLTDGIHSLYVRAVDANGVRGDLSSVDFMVDTSIQAPLWIVKPARSNKVDYNLDDLLRHSGETDETFSKYQCKVNSSSTWGSCRINSTNYPSVATYRTNGATTTVVARQVDRAGNVSGPSETYSWIHDNVPPATPVWTAKPSGNTTSTSATLAWRMPTAPSGQTYSAICWRDTYWAPCTSPVTWDNLSGGHHVFAVIVTDDAGNESTQILAEWNVSRPAVSDVTITPDSDPVGVHTELEAVGGALTGEAGASAGRVIWERCTIAATPVCTAVSSKDATQRKYYLVEADMGYKMRATVTWKTLGGVTTSKTSGYSGMVVPTAAASEFVFQTGQTGPVRGKTMGMKAGRIEGFNGLPDKGVQWQRCTGTTADTCTNITGALGLRYLPTADDIGKRLRAVWSLTAPTSGALKGYQVKSATPLSGVVAAK